VAPLAAFARRLRERGYGAVADFDPLDGGVAAQALFLFEKVGPKASASGFISRNNDDGTAANTFRFLRQAGIPREVTCLWNVVPGWNGTISLTPTELARGAEALSELLALLPALRVVVLVGKRAQRAWSAIDCKLPVIHSAHPSPKNYAMAREIWEAIPDEWAKIRDYLPTAAA
jgi:hypothetical protein